jgi:hypothetical protein
MRLLKLLPLLVLLASAITGRCGLSVTLAWEGSPDANVTNYVLYVGTASNRWTEVINVGMTLASWTGSTNVPPLPLPPHTSTNAPTPVSSTNNLYPNLPPSTMLPGSSGSGGNGATYSCVYTGLVPGREYWFMITAQDDIGMESLPSNALSFTVPSGMAPLGGFRVFIP